MRSVGCFGFIGLFKYIRQFPRENEREDLLVGSDSVRLCSMVWFVGD